MTKKKDGKRHSHSVLSYTRTRPRTGDLVFTKTHKGLSRNPSMQVFFSYFLVKEAYELTPRGRGLATLNYGTALRQYGA